MLWILIIWLGQSQPQTVSTFETWQDCRRTLQVFQAAAGPQAGGVCAPATYTH